MKQINNNLVLVSEVVKAITGVAGASFILSEHHPYLALISLAVGAGANEFILAVEKEKNRKK